MCEACILFLCVMFMSSVCVSVGVCVCAYMLCTTYVVCVVFEEVFVSCVYYFVVTCL